MFQTGCEGPQGPQGIGISDLDFEPPEISFVWPEGSDTVYSDTVNAIVRATDNDSVLFVEFFIDSKNDTVDGLARDSFPDDSDFYQITWNLEKTGVSYGLHSLVARAVDLQGNDTYTPPILLYRSLLPHRQMLVYDLGNYSNTVMILPDTYGDKNFNVRFSPLAPCRIVQIRMDIVDPTGIPYEGTNLYEGVCDFEIKIWSSVNKYPHELLESIEVAADTFTFSDYWSEFDLSNSDLGTISGDFHAGISPVDENYSQYQNERLGIALYYTADEVSEIDPINHRSIEQETTGWGTIMNDWGEKRDFHIRAIVDYGSGELDILEPVPTPRKVSGKNIVSGGK